VRDIALAVVVFGLLPFVFTRPHWGILMWTWAGLMVPQTLTFGFMRTVPIAMIIGVVTLIAVLVSREKKPIPMLPPVVALLIFLLWANFTTLIALYPDQAWPYWEKVMKVMLMIFVTIMIMQSKERITALVWVATLSIAFFGVKGGIYTLTRGGDGMVLGPGAGIHAHRNSIATALVMSLPFLYWLQLSTNRRWIRLALIGSMVLVAIAVLGTFSRGGLLTIAAMGAWLWLKSRQKLMIAILFAIVVPPILHFMPENWHERMGTIEKYQEDGSSMGRLNAWNMAWNLAKERPLTGAGFDCFVPDAFARWSTPEKYGLPSTEWHDSHSIWFRVLAEHGFPGIGLYILFWFLVWRLGTVIIREARHRPDLRWAKDLAAMCQVSLIGFWVGGTFVNLQYWDFPYLIMAILVLTQVVIRRSPQESPKPSPAVAGGSIQLQAPRPAARTDASR
jgi:probable O-glycosylation ligase (exosortase A-associated)